MGLFETERAQRDRVPFFCTEELRLATGASVPVARKNKCVYTCFIYAKEGMVKGLYTVFSVNKKSRPPLSSENSEIQVKK